MNRVDTVTKAKLMTSAQDLVAPGFTAMQEVEHRKHISAILTQVTQNIIALKEPLPQHV